MEHIENEPAEGNTLERNPFLMPPVLRSLLKSVRTPDLKGLRRISSLWDRMVKEEMEMRAWKVEYPKLGFDTNHYWKTINSDPLRNFENFFNSTTTFPNLYRSFNFDFPGAPLVLGLPKFAPFFEIYSPRLVELAIPCNFNFKEDARSNARNLLRGFIHRMAPTLVQLNLSTSGFIADLPIPEQGSIERILFPKLETLTLGHSAPDRPNRYDGSITSAFSSLFGQGNCLMPRLKRLEIFTASGNFEDLFGPNLVDPIQWRTLASLELEFAQSFYDDDVHRFINGLMFLGRSGMALEELSLTFKLKGEISHQVAGNLSQFLQSHSTSLETLSLNLSINARNHNNEVLDLETLARITLPLCPSLKSLDISAMHYRFLEETLEYLQLYNLISLPKNFPILERLSLCSPCDTTMALLRKPVDPAERRHLEVFEYKSLDWPNSEWTEKHNEHLFKNFSTVGVIKIN